MTRRERFARHPEIVSVPKKLLLYAGNSYKLAAVHF
jgi:hypothetical protein